MLVLRMQRCATAWLLLTALAGALACNASSDRVQQTPRSVEAPTPSQVGTLADESQPDAGRDSWDVILMDDKRVGYDHKTERTETRDGRTVRRTEAETRMLIKRFGETVELLNRYTSLETPEGELLAFTSEGLPADSVGEVHDGTLTIETTSAGNKAVRSLDWPDDAGGFFAEDQSLRGRPMQPGETRTLRFLQPAFNTLGTEELTAGDYEPTELPSGAQDLLRIESRLTIDGSDQPVTATHWADRQGEVLKTVLPAMQLTFYRATEAEATATAAEAPLDLGVSSVVPLEQPFHSARQSHRAIYRLELTDGNPAAAFPTCATQQPRATGPHTAELTVTSLDPQSPPAEIGPAAPPSPDDRGPNSLVQSDDPAIVAMSREAAGAKKSPLAKALALERYVHEHIREKNFSITFASAAEVAKQMSGDCSEHAVLLAALARAAEIPARAAVGLVYAPSENGFAYHMWNELFIDGRWVPLDATLGQGRVGADHLKLADSNLHDATGLVSFLPVVEVLGKLKIELVAAD